MLSLHNGRVSVRPFQQGLERTRRSFFGRLKDLVLQPTAPEEYWQQLEAILIGADISVSLADDVVKGLRFREVEGVIDVRQLERELRQELVELLDKGAPELRFAGTPGVVLIVGVNGSGKTTTAVKLAKRLKDEGKRPLLAAADTFRAAAIEQLEIWARRVDVPVVAGRPGGDPAAVVFDAVRAATARGHDVVIADTAGRLHTKEHLMAELAKVVKVVGRAREGAPDEVLLVLDGTTGQNAIPQAHVFTEAARVTGLVIAKLDGTAKGGAVFTVTRELGIPVKFLGVGEKPEDLAPMDARAFVDALFGRDGV